MLKFIGIGAQKAGTTWLYTMLSQHPQICFPKGKELHFWNNQHPTPDQYLSLFTSPTLSEGEITPAYGHLPLTTIQTLHGLAPQLKLLYLLRNPIERAWSSAMMALKRAEMTIDEASDAWFIDHFNSKGSQSRGDYEKCLKNWLTCFPREQLLIIYNESIKQEPLTVLELCCQHLDLPFFDPEAQQQLRAERRIFPGPEHRPNTHLQQVLLALYEPKIRSLAHYLDVPLDHWLTSQN